MIQLKVRRSDSIMGKWACEEIKQNTDLNAPLGMGDSIQEAIEDFERSFTTLIGMKPDYKWMGIIN